MREEAFHATLPVKLFHCLEMMSALTHTHTLGLSAKTRLDRRDLPYFILSPHRLLRVMVLPQSGCEKVVFLGRSMVV